MLITITEACRVEISPHLSENDTPVSLMRWQGKKILLPNDPRYWPLQANLAQHRARFHRLS